MIVTGRFRPKVFLSLLCLVSSGILLSKTVLQNTTSSDLQPISSGEPAIYGPSFSKITPPRFFHWTAKPCIQPQPPLLVIVHSSPSHVRHRKAIRQTWGSSTQSKKGIKTVFVVGRSNLPKIQRRVLLESEEYGDIVGVEMLDSYNNLTLKHLAGLHWSLKNCPNVSYILKTDDDAFVDVQRALKVVESAFSGDLSRDVLACRVVPQGTSPRRLGKWMVTRNDYPYQEYPEYCSGLAYFARPSTLSKVYEAAMSGRVPYLWIDDVFVTGLAAQVAGVSRLDLGVWFARTEQEVVKWIRDGKSKHRLPWIIAEMTPRHWPLEALALWNKTKETEKHLQKLQSFSF